MMILEDYILPVATLSPFYLPVSMLISYIVCYDYVFIFFFVLSLLSSGLNIGIKKIVGKLFAGRDFIRRPKRPDNCCSVMPKNCDLASLEPGVKGMPSGHCQLATLFAVFFAMHLFGHYTSYMKFLPIIGLFIFAGFVLWSRNYIGCHSPIQIFVGGAIGIALALGGYALYSYSASWFGYTTDTIGASPYLYFGTVSLAALMMFCIILYALYK